MDSDTAATLPDGTSPRGSTDRRARLAPRSWLVRFAAALLVASALLVVTPPPGHAATTYVLPFAAGQTWYVCAGYNGSPNYVPSHTGKPSLDWTTTSQRGPNGCYGGASSAANQPIYAPASGSIVNGGDGSGTLFINYPNGKSMGFTHLVGRRGNGPVNQGDLIGRVAPAGEAQNNGYAHLHLAAYSAHNGGGSRIAFDAAHDMKFDCAPDMSYSGAQNQWAGTSVTAGCAPAGPPSDGSFVSYEGHVYRVAGGAPIYVSSWDPFGGAQPTRALSPGEFAALRAHPRDGVFIRGQSSGRVFTMAGGSPQYVSTWDRFGGAQPFVNVDDAAIDNAGGGPPWSHLRRMPLDGTLISAQPSGRVYRVAGGAPLYVSSWESIGGSQPTVAIDEAAVDNAGGSGTWGYLASRPSDVFLHGHVTGRVFRVVNGGHPYYVPSWDPYGGVQPFVDVDDAAIDNCDHLQCGPFGNYEGLVSRPERITVSGWTMDPGSAEPIGLRIYANGELVGAGRADGDRPDVDAVYHRGAGFGFTATAETEPGEQHVCVQAVNVGFGANTELGCRDVVVPAKEPSRVVASLVNRRVTVNLRAVLRVRVATAGAVPTGWVKVIKAGKALASAALDRTSGRTRIVLPRMRVGRHSLKVVYGGNTLYSEAQSDRILLVVRRR